MYTNLETGNACKQTPFSALVILTTAVIIKMSKLELQLLIYNVCDRLKVLHLNENLQKIITSQLHRSLN